MKHDVKIPNTNSNMPAKWGHITDFYSLNRDLSLVMAHKLTEQHLFNVNFQHKMKVKLAAQVLSNSCAAALDVYIGNNLMSAATTATSQYCKTFNDLFDILNSSSPRDPVPLRRPLWDQSKSTQKLKEFKEWLEGLELLNKDLRNKFMKGWIQDINVLLALLSALKEEGIKYLSTRNLCQDPLELFFLNIRYSQKVPDAKQFGILFRRKFCASLFTPSSSANCDFDHAASALTLEDF